MLEIVAKAAIWDYHVECDRCSAAIDVSVLVCRPSPAIAKHTLNELLVDFGWLPTVRGGFCRSHALQLRGR
ncbi:hypothetical protein MANY_13480 [Mycolicibacterium anyangense]|jgi:hypothetical protein|uniref:Uncharacterized protein n=1 Tax=Mycolicibacterium anyangense TaxID=1431246 RepID=A0A6N4W9W3_9MYCO|nr:hypothetical protein [Mycolicibacterium anyangense]BBZ76011.1 hypothetical protein MANY_13480 [Mycolicibacterium anyangense]